jgi:serpin B
MLTKTNLFLIIIVASLSLVVSRAILNPVSTPASDPVAVDLNSSEQSILLSDQAFAFKFFERLFIEESKEDENFMVSPLSLSMALAMTLNGTANETKTAMQQALNMSNFSDDELNAYYKTLKKGLLTRDSSTKLSISNAIFANKNITFNQDFINTNKSFYDATVQSVNFSKAKTVDIINKWASDSTNGLIEKVIDSTNELDIMYLLNAIYFKGTWVHEFKKRHTSKNPFRGENGTVNTVNMMNQSESVYYTEDHNLQLVQLPYGNNSFSMLVLLPKGGKKLQDVVSAILENNYWENLKSRLYKNKVELSLPKFKTEYSKKLNDVLTTMGMGIAFTTDADFSRMSDRQGRIDYVKQDTYISVDESGTEAAAVTTVAVMANSFEQSIIEFNANRPFLYIIQENSTGAILFMGAIKKLQ